MAASLETAQKEHKINLIFIMKINKPNLLILILIVFTINFSQSQNKINRINSSDENGFCTRKRNISFKNRIQNFPFNLTSQIVFISYKTKFDNKSKDSLQFDAEGMQLQKLLNSIKIGQDSINEKYFLESKKLDFKQTEKLTDVFFNYGFKSKYYVTSDTKCYEPRNAIIFINKDNKVIAFIEICFACQHIRSSDQKIGFGEYCEQKYDLVKEIFKESGIKYGVIDRD